MSGRGLHESFSGLPGQHWQRLERGRGRLEPAEAGLRFVTEFANRRNYSDAQIDDYQGLARRDFLWHPPLRLLVRARFSHPAAETRAPLPLRGTAGFGFWNDPFLMTGLRLPALPSAIWFFYASPPSDMRLDTQTPGWGWKAAAIDAARWPAPLLLPLAPLVLPAMNVPPLYRRLWPLALRGLHVGEARIAASMTEWHSYALEWDRASARFLVDGALVLACPAAPLGPLGFVMWLDNQYLVATPQGRFRYGLLDIAGKQWLEAAEITIERQ